MLMGEQREVLFAEPLWLEQPMPAWLCLIETRQRITAKTALAGLEGFAETLVLFRRHLPDVLIGARAALRRHLGEKLYKG